MDLIYLKRAAPPSPAEDIAVRDRVETMLSEIERGREDAALRYSRDLDGWTGESMVSADALEAVESQVSQQLKDDICFARDNVRRFAQAQRAAIRDVEIEILPGLTAGHRNIPLETAGCYVPGGRYAHIASAIMSVTTAKVAGVKTVVACSPPRRDGGIHPAQLFALKACGADMILNMGGVQGIAAMTFGLFGCPPADIVCGPGNPWVAEAKRLLYGRVAIDMFAGPTENLVIADGTADADLVAADLVGQAEHGHNSPVWLVSLDAALAERVLNAAPKLIDALPEPNRSSARQAWRDFGEVIVAPTRESAVRAADRFASEHVEVHCADLDWWRRHLQNYGSLFLGAETTVAFGDKVSGPNHILPTKRAARYTGGLSVGKFLKTATWQRMNTDALRAVATSCARISRAEGMEGHARTADARLRKWCSGGGSDV